MFERPTRADEVSAFVARLAGVDASVLDDAERIDLLRALEELKCAAEAAQAEVAAHLGGGDDRSVGALVALARRESPHRGQRHLGLARILRNEMPCTRTAFRAGAISEQRATVIAQETACLSREDRATVDRAIAGDPDALACYSDRVLLGELRKLAARLDPASVAERRRRAEAERRVTVRPAPDTMAYLTVLLPVAQAVACYAALAAAADAGAGADGEPRGRGQIMADLLVTRITGAATTAGRPVVPVSIGLVMSDRALFAGAHDTAHLSGLGPIPAGLARELLADHLDTGSRTWLRRLYTSPDTGQLVAMDSRQRLFRGKLAEFLELRDQFCRHPWCNAPIRHHDHITGIAGGGRTAAEDGQGLCEACNYTKEAPGWRARPRPSPDTPAGHTVEITAPTGHTYTSTAPPLLALRVGAYQQVREGVWSLVS
jgi:hypothetical protein